ncbi:MAG: MoaD/ThiS family protein [Deltaproteobacteria bacterium]|nr:MoaD/ThiS family protein [Deltaproteobacteria bacterium]
MNLKIDVELSSVFHTACPLPQLSLELKEEEGTVQGLLLRLSEEYGETMRNLLFEKGKESVIPGLMVMVNDQTHTGVALNQRDVALMEGYKVSLLYFVSGG